MLSRQTRTSDPPTPSPLLRQHPHPFKTEERSIAFGGTDRIISMGCATSAALDCCVPVPQWTVIVVGLDGAGKTSIVSHMKRTLTEGVFGPTNGVRLEELRAHQAKWQVRATVKKGDAVRECW
jgi:hypothetical protein